MPSLAQVICVTLTDWMGADRRQAVGAAMPRPTSFLSLLEGHYGFQASGAAPPQMPNVTGNGGVKDHLLPVNWGRLGVRAPRPLPDHLRAITVQPGEKILVLGTSEFVYPPFQLAQRLAQLGAEVKVQATTRSPILEGLDIKGVLEFPDAYGDGIPNFLYGVRPGLYDRILVCYETPPETAQSDLLTALNAEPVYFNKVGA
jgi:hypothetical protein